ncbi:anti-phage ZorAB system protein ZorA [Massilia sp. W12]|uniref:anti-phage ZorAB system protein ZorA n=1 Tax=Massilia sp. W12 TaxID=3126507 RepID=UPI0030CB61BD
MTVLLNLIERLMSAHPYITWILLLFLFLFCAFFLVPGILHYLRLCKIIKNISAINEEPPNLKAFSSLFNTDPSLLHLWSEYKESLHLQYKDENGMSKVAQVRATLPAEMFFNKQYVVDSRLHTEFFKHLPGLFTGIGIIGTFGGLIQGLAAFKVSENAATVRESLETLMKSVGEAFVVSAMAIFLAMLATVLEKWLLAALYKKTEEIAHAIDKCFESGVGEEYLSQLVKSSAESATQAKILKDALVKDLRDLLTEVTQAQIAAHKEQQSSVIDSILRSSHEQLAAARQNNQALGESIANSIQNSLKEPLEAIANTVKIASGDHSANTSRMLQDVMASFSQRLQDLFGGQIAGLSELNQQTARSVQDAVSTLQTLVAKIEETTLRSGDAMAQRMAEALENMEARQAAMQTQSAAFIDQIRQLVAQSQSKTQEKLQDTLTTIGAQMGDMLQALNTKQEQAFAHNEAREKVLNARSDIAVSKISESVTEVVNKIGAASELMAKSVGSLSQASTSSIDKMQTSAEVLNNAARNFAHAGDRVSGVMNQSVTVADKLSEAAGGLSVGATSIQDVLKDYRQQREMMLELMQQLRATVEGARKEAALTDDVLRRIETSAARLADAQMQADEYLDGVSNVLAESHEAFATEVRRTLDKANSEFHNKLTSAVGMLSSSVSELETVLSTMSPNPVQRSRT